MDKLFLEAVIHHYKHPQHRGAGAGRACHAENLSCGDSITVRLEIQNGQIKSATYDGQLCSIANYGADLLMSKIIGQPLAAAQKISSAELLKTAGADLLKNPVRLKCFELAQVALKSHPTL
jgi:nitrogen fixation NifU-like protein